MSSLSQRNQIRKISGSYTLSKPDLHHAIECVERQLFNLRLTSLAFSEATAKHCPNDRATKTQDEGIAPEVLAVDSIERNPVGS